MPGLTPAMIKFFVPIQPTSQARGRAGINKATGRAMLFHGPKQRRDQNDLIALMAPFAPETPLNGPLTLGVRVALPVPRSWPKKKKAAALEWDVRPAVKPDLDNYLKQIMDCMTKLRFWLDDSQVVEISALKVYDLKPGWVVILEECQ